MLGVEKSRYKFELIKDHKDELHPGKSVDIIFQNKVIGKFGELHPNKITEYDLGKTNAVVLEMELDALLDAKVSTVKMSPISRFPSVSRDLAFIVDKNILVRDILKTIKIVGRGLVNNAEVFDVYEGKGIPENKKSIAISVEYQKEDATLTDKEVNDVEEQIKFELLKTYKAELRG